jgi:hypothetical protein
VVIEPKKSGAAGCEEVRKEIEAEAPNETPNNTAPSKIIFRYPCMAATVLPQSLDKKPLPLGAEAGGVEKIRVYRVGGLAAGLIAVVCLAFGLFFLEECWSPWWWAGPLLEITGAVFVALFIYLEHKMRQLGKTSKKKESRPQKK